MFTSFFVIVNGFERKRKHRAFDLYESVTVPRNPKTCVFLRATIGTTESGPSDNLRFCTSNAIIAVKFKDKCFAGDVKILQASRRVAARAEFPQQPRTIPCQGIDVIVLRYTR